MNGTAEALKIILLQHRKHRKYNQNVNVVKTQNTHFSSIQCMHGLLNPIQINHQYIVFWIDFTMTGERK